MGTAHHGLHGEAFEMCGRHRLSDPLLHSLGGVARFLGSA
jgi:hypothetical protein